MATADNTSEVANAPCASACSSSVQFPLLGKTSVPTPLNPNSLQQTLRGYDQAETHFLVDGFTHEFRRNYFGTHTLNCTHNHPSTSVHRDVGRKKLSKDLLLGRIAGPVLTLSFLDFQSSPLQLVDKKEPNAIRLIHLAYTPADSFNESIPKDFVDHVVHLLSQFARGPLEGKTDIEDAFRIVPIHPSCYRVFGFPLETSATIVVCLWGVLNG